MWQWIGSASSLPHTLTYAKVTDVRRVDIFLDKLPWKVLKAYLYT
jgi:hypothetical protein